MFRDAKSVAKSVAMKPRHGSRWALKFSIASLRSGCRKAVLLAVLRHHRCFISRATVASLSSMSRLVEGKQKSWVLNNICSSWFQELIGHHRRHSRRLYQSMFLADIHMRFTFAWWRLTWPARYVTNAGEAPSRPSSSLPPRHVNPFVIVIYVTYFSISYSIPRPSQPLTYTFTPFTSGTTLLMPPQTVADLSPAYNISVALDLNPFVPLSYITTIRQGGTAAGQVVGSFELSINQRRGSVTIGMTTKRLANVLWSIQGSLVCSPHLFLASILTFVHSFIGTGQYRTLVLIFDGTVAQHLMMDHQCVFAMTRYRPIN